MRILYWNSGSVGAVSGVSPVFLILPCWNMYPDMGEDAFSAASACGGGKGKHYIIMRVIPPVQTCTLTGGEWNSNDWRIPISRPKPYLYISPPRTWELRLPVRGRPNAEPETLWSCCFSTITIRGSVFLSPGNRGTGGKVPSMQTMVPERLLVPQFLSAKNNTGLWYISEPIIGSEHFWRNFANYWLCALDVIHIWLWLCFRYVSDLSEAWGFKTFCLLFRHIALEFRDLPELRVTLRHLRGDRTLSWSPGTL